MIPYPGLRPFRQDEAHLFFGRERHTDELIEHLGRGRFLAVVGPSGCGKSSLVRTGLLPGLEGGLLPAAGTHWREAVMRPAGRPFANLAEALAPLFVGAACSREGGASTNHRESRLQAAPTGTGEEIGEIEACLRRGPLSLHELLQERPLADDANLLLIVDQFEELFRYAKEQDETQADPAAEAAAFVALLLATARDYPLANGGLSRSVYLVLTMRSDFIGDCARFPGLAEAVNRGLWLTPRLDREQMRAAIEEPAWIGGGEADPGLVQRLLNDAAHSQDQLPLLQHLLMRLWLKVSAGAETLGVRLTPQDYEAMGGFEDALSNHADEVFLGLGDEKRRIAEVLFRALSERGADRRDTRRPVTLDEAAAVAGVACSEVAEVVRPFAAAGCNFIVHSGELAPGTMLDITHEALIRQWRRLQAWTADEADRAELYRRLEAAAQRHEKGEGALWIDPDLQIALDWRDGVGRRSPEISPMATPPMATPPLESAPGRGSSGPRAGLQDGANRPTDEWAKRYGGDFAKAMRFLDASLAAREAQKKAAEQERQAKLRRARRVAAGSLIGLALTLGLAGWAVVERIKSAKAEQAAQQSEQTRTEALFDASLTHAALLARVEDPAEARNVLRQTTALDLAIPAPRRHARNLLAGYVAILGGQADKVYEGAGAKLIDLALSPDGRIIAAAGERGTLVLFDAESGKELRRLVGHDPKAGANGTIKAVLFSPDGGLLYSAGQDGRILCWSMPEGERVGEPWQAPAEVWKFALSSDGATMASGGKDDVITLWSTADSKVTRTLKGKTSSIPDGNSIAFTPDGRLVSGGYKGDVGLWDLAPLGEQPREQVLPRIHTDQVNAVAASPDGRWLATGGTDRRIVLWQLAGEGARPLRQLQGHTNIVMGLRFTPEGRLLSASRDNTMRLWDLESGATLRIFQGHTAGLWSIALGNPPGLDDPADFQNKPGSIYTAANDGTVRRWPLTTPGQWLWDLPGEPISAAIDLQGAFVSVGFANGALRLYPLPAVGGGDERTPTAGQEPAADVGPRPAPSDRDQPNLQAPSDQVRPRPRNVPIAEVEDAHEAGKWVLRQAYSPDGQLLATSSHDNTAKLWRIDRTSNGPALTLLHTLEGHTATVHAVAFSPDGRTIATAGYDGRVGLFDVESGKGELFEAHDGRITSLGFDADGKTLLTTGNDDFTLRLWNPTATPPKALAPPLKSRDAITWGAIKPDARQLAAVGRENVVTIQDLGPDLAQPLPQPRRLAGHEQTVLRAEYTPDGTQLFTVSGDMTLRLWDLGTDKPLFTLRLPANADNGVPLWDFALRCLPAAAPGAAPSPDAGHCWIAVPLTMGRLALYRLPY
jgi:WD40 repeat protein/energy-coupling factor transporter ATP-binding protein EcfA2